MHLYAQIEPANMMMIVVFIKHGRLSMLWKRYFLKQFFFLKNVKETEKHKACTAMLDLLFEEKFKLMELDSIITKVIFFIYKKGDITLL